MKKETKILFQVRIPLFALFVFYLTTSHLSNAQSLFNDTSSLIAYVDDNTAKDGTYSALGYVDDGLEQNDQAKILKESDLCDSPQKYVGEIVVVSTWFSSRQQPGDKWGLKNKSKNLEKLHSSMQYPGLGKRINLKDSWEDIAYIREAGYDCKIILLIPYDNIDKIPNTDNALVAIAGQVFAPNVLVVGEIKRR